eukprot:SAG31_NODE_2064_length_6532_cov_3.118918_3_plen_141_part_00
MGCSLIDCVAFYSGTMFAFEEDEVPLNQLAAAQPTSEPEVEVVARLESAADEKQQEESRSHIAPARPAAVLPNSKFRVAGTKGKGRAGKGNRGSRGKGGRASEVEEGGNRKPGTGRKGKGNRTNHNRASKNGKAKGKGKT